MDKGVEEDQAFDGDKPDEEIGEKFTNGKWFRFHVWTPLPRPNLKGYFHRLHVQNNERRGTTTTTENEE